MMFNASQVRLLRDLMRSPDWSHQDTVTLIDLDRLTDWDTDGPQ